MKDPQTEIQELRDMLQGALNQRNASQNECLQLAAQVAALLREVEVLRAKADAAPELPLPKPNGAHNEAALQ